MGAIAVSGHRPRKLGGYGHHNPLRDRLKAKVAGRLEQLCSGDAQLEVNSGMAQGWDQWVVEVCIELAVPFAAYLPFVGQEARWPLEARQHYQHLLTKATRIEVVSPGGYQSGKMMVRNRRLVDESPKGLLVAWDGSPSGTANTVQYAVSIGRAWENFL